MPDPFEELKELSVGMPARPLPASEVRRRGDRMRRRRTAFQGAGAAVAVAVLAGGGLLVGDGVTGTGPPPRPATQAPSPTSSAPEPPDGWVSEIPEAFPLAVGLPAPEPEGNAPRWSTSDAADVAWAYLPCSDRNTGQSSFPSDADRTDASFIFAQTPPRSHVRHLTVYEDGGSASAAVAQILTQARACGPEEAIPASTEFRWEVSPASALGGEEAWLVSGGEYDAGGSGREPSRVLIGLVREGNAVLMARLGDASTADPADLTEPTAAEWVADVTTMSGAMCVFAVQPCSPSGDEVTESPDAPDEVAVTRIPDGFDLALGIPPDDADSERTRSTRLDRELALDPCHQEGSHPTGPARTDFAQVLQTVPAGAYVHQLAVYLDAAAADEALTELMRDLEACSTYAYPDGVSEDRWTRLDSDPTRFGVDGALVAVNHAYSDGMRMTLATHHIAVRVGNAVLVVVRDGEFGFTDDGVAEIDAHQRVVAAELIAQMCPFAGPSSALDCGTASAASTDLETLDPGGLGPVRLGMSGEEVEATGLVTLEDGHGTACTAYAAPSGGDAVATGSISTEFGVESIAVRSGVATPEGIALGSTIDEVRASYAHLVGDETRMSATASDAAAYWFEITDGVVTGLRLELTAHAC